MDTLATFLDAGKPCPVCQERMELAELKRVHPGPLQISWRCESCKLTWTIEVQDDDSALS